MRLKISSDGRTGEGQGGSRGLDSSRQRGKAVDHGIHPSPARGDLGLSRDVFFYEVTYQWGPGGQSEEDQGGDAHQNGHDPIPDSELMRVKNDDAEMRKER